MRLTVQIGFALACAALASPGQAGAEDAPFSSTVFSSDNAVAADTLEHYRGGFTTDTGLAVSLGLERIVTINGNTVAQNAIDFGDLGRLTSGQAQLDANAVGQLHLIQNGVGNNFSVDLGTNALGGTVIQNTLNNQLINNQTIINANVNARGLLQAMNFQSSLANALNSAAIKR